mgnify:CR=1 FL=1
MTTVYVLQENNHDYSPAEVFGEVRFITNDDVRSTVGCQQNERVALDVRKFLDDYRAGEDHIVIAGNPVLVFMVAHALGRRNGGLETHNILKWDGRQARYIQHSVKLLEVV